MRKKRKKFRHLGQKNRDRIEALLKAQHTQEETASVLKVDAGTISREIKMYSGASLLCCVPYSRFSKDREDKKMRAPYAHGIQGSA